MTVAAAASRVVLLIGRESVGKSQLISSISGHFAGESNFRGSTVSIQRYASNGTIYIDTPGILRRSDTETTRRALCELRNHETVLLVVQASGLDEDLKELLPLVAGRQGLLVITFRDRIPWGRPALEAIEKLEADLGIPIVPVNARSLTCEDRTALQQAIEHPRQFARSRPTVRTGWRIEPQPGPFEHRLLGPVLVCSLLLLPLVLTVCGANWIAERMHPVVAGWIAPLVLWIETACPAWIQWIFVASEGDFGYGLLNMGPFLLVWALPTVLLFSLILGACQASGIVERMNIVLHPLVRHLGLSGRDVVRVMMGFGCNVPAVVSTRACSDCSRRPAIAAIAFGAACSYQLPATLAVLSSAADATGRSGLLLSLLFLAYLFLTTIVYLWLTSPAKARNQLNVLMTTQRPFLQWPTLRGLWREARGTVRQFFLRAMPVFVLICVAASFLSRLGLLDAAARFFGPIMTVFNLPAATALPVVLASVRKDGILLLAAHTDGAIPLTAAQVLTGVYLSGVLFPCLVTMLAIARETSMRLMLGLLSRQAGFAALFSLVLAWGGRWLL